MEKNTIEINPVEETERIVSMIRQIVYKDFNRKGAVVGVSGGIDSATVLALTVKALGPENVLAMALPDQDSSPVSEILAREFANQLSVPFLKEDLTGALSQLGCYSRRDEAVLRVFPDYDPMKDGIKLVLPTDLLERGSLNVYSLALVKDGKEQKKLLPPSAYLTIVAASNMKQRIRMLTLYYYAEMKNYVVIGTSNKNEYAQGFFVKYGDGGADIQPIQHLFKTQVYQLASYLGIPSDIYERTPTTDTYSASTTQEEFYFRLSFDLMDVIWDGLENNISPEVMASKVNLDVKQVEHVYRDLIQKSRTTEYLRRPPVTLQPL